MRGRANLVQVGMGLLVPSAVFCRLEDLPRLLWGLKLLIHLADNVLCSCELGEWSTGIRGQALISPNLSFLTFKMGILVLLPDLVGR